MFRENKCAYYEVRASPAVIRWQALRDLYQVLILISLAWRDIAKFFLCSDVRCRVDWKLFSRRAICFVLNFTYDFFSVEEFRCEPAQIYFRNYNSIISCTQKRKQDEKLNCFKYVSTTHTNMFPSIITYHMKCVWNGIQNLKCMYTCTYLISVHYLCKAARHVSLLHVYRYGLKQVP